MIEYEDMPNEPLMTKRRWPIPLATNREYGSENHARTAIPAAVGYLKRWAISYGS